MKAILTILCLAVAGPAVACKANFPASTKKVIGAKPSQSTWSKALLLATNEARCKQRRGSLRGSGGLVKAAATHSRNMSRTRTFGHTTRVSGSQTMKKRIRGAGVRYRRAAENISRLPAFQFRFNQNYRIVNASACEFHYSGTSSRIPQQTYESLAKTVVAQWMASPGHRKNLLLGGIDKMGGGVAFSNTGACGRYYITQNLTG